MRAGAPKGVWFARPARPPLREVDLLLDSLNSVGRPEARLEVVMKMRAVVDSIAVDFHAALAALDDPNYRAKRKP